LFIDAMGPLRVSGAPSRTPGPVTKPPHAHAHAAGLAKTNSSALTRVACIPGRFTRLDTSVPSALRAGALPPLLDEAPDDPALRGALAPSLAGVLVSVGAVDVAVVVVGSPCVPRGRLQVCARASFASRATAPTLAQTANSLQSDFVRTQSRYQSRREICAL
jgi:hypothetical protein